MNKSKIKAYAPTARKELMAAVAAKAQILGLSDQKIEPVEVKGDVAIIGGRPFPRTVASLRRNLEIALKREGFGQLMERIAFTWFNRFTALRYMELHGFLDHGYRVLSHPKGGNIPEILEHATDVDLRGLDKARVGELRLAENKDADLYRMLLITQCNALNGALPFLFEKTNDETELLLPDNLLHSDSPIRKLVDGIDEADWNEVEIIGWLYQFYISEKKDSVIGKVVKSEDIPAATQLFTPNWIVKYLVQNTLGRQWLATYPQSTLRGKMEFYIEPAEQIGASGKGLVASPKPPATSPLPLSPSHQPLATSPSSLVPELITFFDPACGSGHILVEAYDLFKQIYEERGYARRDIPRLILEKNLFGLDIDERAAQFASFALMMKARADDRGLFRANPPVRPNVMAIQESNGLDAEELVQGLGASGQGLVTSHQSLATLLKVFENAKTYGSLIRVPDEMAKVLPTLEKLIDPNIGRDLPGMVSANALSPLVEQAKVLANVYDHVVANPPYMGNKYLNPLLKDYLKKNFKEFEKDLFSTFIVKNLEFSKETGSLGFMTPFVWMFISSYEELRNKLIDQTTISSLIQLEYSGFDGATVPICTFTLLKKNQTAFLGSYIRLSDFKGAENQAPKTLEAIRNPNCGWFFNAKPDDFKKIPGNPIAYWVSDRFRSIFQSGKKISDKFESGGRIKTHNDAAYVRFVWEIDSRKRGKKWKELSHGGEFRRWYGNRLRVVDWSQTAKDKYKEFGGLSNPKYWERVGITCSKITSSLNSFRIKSEDQEFSSLAPSIFSSHDCIDTLLSTLLFLNSKVVEKSVKLINPTLTLNVGDFLLLPSQRTTERQTQISRELIELSKADWNSVETSWDFARFPWLPETLTLTLSHGDAGAREQESDTGEMGAGQLPLPAGRVGEGGGEGPLPASIRANARELRKNQTDAEQLMWGILRDRQFADKKFRRQHPIENRFILDFYCQENKLAIELDGGQHNEDVKESDENRTDFLHTMGIEVVRFWNNDVLQKTESVLEALWEKVEELTGKSQKQKDPHPDPLPRVTRGEGVRDTLRKWFDEWGTLCHANVRRMRELETENNRVFIEAYGLQDEMTPEVPEEQITLTVNPKYRYGKDLTEEEYQTRFRYDSTKELLSYAVGCMMGRYSLDKTGLVYADAGNEGFDHSQYKTFPADDDGIVPTSDIDWFADDATPRLVEFIKTVFGAETVDENLAWIATSFDPKKDETAKDTIRRYFATKFFKDHMQMYKKRPIYWLFSSGKQKAFEALVYLHRYNESTLSRMRAQYVTPLQGKLNARIEHLRREIDGVGSAAAKTKLRKEVEVLVKKQTELAKFDEELRHYSDQRIKLDLDNGVRVNYGKFGNLLAETKAITGGDDE